MLNISLERHDQIIDAIRDLAGKGIVKGDTVILRHFRAPRLGLVKTTGTDRDAKSIVYGDRTDFSGRHEDGDFKPPQQITYARTLAFRQEPPISTTWGDRQPLIFIDGMDYLKKLSPDMCQVAYDPNELVRKSENELWFKGDPKDAVIAVFTVDPTK